MADKDEGPLSAGECIIGFSTNIQRSGFERVSRCHAERTLDAEGYFPVKAISFSKDAVGLDVDWRNFSDAGKRNETDSVISGGMTRSSFLWNIHQGGKVIASDYLAWCLI